MAVYKSMSPRMYAIALATVVVLFVTMEVGEVKANCDQGGILSELNPCISLTSPPSYDSTCCGAMRYVHYNMKPTDDCICSIAKLQLLAALGLSVADMKLVIKICVGPLAIPPCLG
ncbi:unnamed protein product [Calypogeia fissa]